MEQGFQVKPETTYTPQGDGNVKVGRIEDLTPVKQLTPRKGTETSLETFLIYPFF